MHSRQRTWQQPRRESRRVSTRQVQRQAQHALPLSSRAAHGWRQQQRDNASAVGRCIPRVSAPWLCRCFRGVPCCCCWRWLLAAQRGQQAGRQRMLRRGQQHSRSELVAGALLVCQATALPADCDLVAAALTVLLTALPAAAQLFCNPLADGCDVGEGQAHHRLHERGQGAHISSWLGKVGVLLSQANRKGERREELTVCAHFLPDRSTRADTSSGNTSPVGLGAGPRLSPSAGTAHTAREPCTRPWRSCTAPASPPCRAASPSSASSAARAMRRGRQAGRDEKGSTLQSCRAGYGEGGHLCSGAPKPALCHPDVPLPPSPATPPRYATPLPRTCANGWMGGRARNAAATAPLSASRPYLARAEARGA